MRIEKDSLGELELPDDAFYGIHSLRSSRNFPNSGELIHLHLIKSYLQVKLASAETNYKCGILFKNKFEVIEEAINELIAETDACIKGNMKSIYEKVIVDPFQGGAGTSLNMNINEIIANTALRNLEKEFGSYNIVHPLDDVNLNQSTSDTFLTALKIAAIYLLRELADSFENLQNAFRKKEEEFRNILKLARTQFQDAVPISLGQEFGAYSRAMARDVFRLKNAEEKLYPVNLGGMAVGDSGTISKEYVMNVSNVLKKITKLPVVKGDDLIDATQNLDMIVEVHGMVLAGATSIMKICNDLRFLSSGPAGGIGEINLPPMQAGSSMMPGKVNPVILENAIQICEVVKSHDIIITNLVSNGNLEMNPFMPLIAHTLLKSFSLLRASNNNLAEKCIDGITANPERCKMNLINSSAIAASLVSSYGYDTIQELVVYAHEHKIPFIQSLMKSKLLSEKELYNLISKDLGIELL